MYWIKKIVRAILNLLPVLLVSFVSVSPVSASQHEYKSIPFFSLTGPAFVYNPSSGHKEWVTNSSNGSVHSTLGGRFQLVAEGNAWNSDYNSVYLKHSQSYLLTDYDSDANQCVYNSVQPIFHFSKNNNTLAITTAGSIWTNDSYQVDNNYRTNHCTYLHQFGHGKNAEFKNSSLPNSLMSCNDSNGAVCGGLWNTKEYVSDQILPYPYSSAVFATYGKATNSAGITYEHSFSPLSEMFNQKIDKFSYLALPLTDYSDYWRTSSNFPQGRHLTFNGTFLFTDTVTPNPDFITNSNSDPDIGVFLHYNSVKYYGSDSTLIDIRIKCQASFHNGQVGDSQTHRFEFQCPMDLPDSFLYFKPYLEIDGGGSYVWTSNGDWRFGVLYLVSDNDNTPGQDFGTDFKGGGGYTYGDPVNYVVEPSSSDESLIDTIGAFVSNFRENLFNLFGFNFLNPFAPLFALFTSGNECVNIPIIAGMVHSEENTVCPWFPAQVRNIVTPVIMFVALMILFGFVVRWSKSSSSDFSPISKGGHE